MKTLHRFLRTSLVLVCIVLIGACAAPTAQEQPPTATTAPTDPPPSPTIPAASPTAPPPTASIAATSAPSATIAPSATLEPPTPTSVPFDQLEGRDAAGGFTRGNPQAAVVLTDYSDFL
jgi:hypothetical protein